MCETTPGASLLTDTPLTGAMPPTAESVPSHDWLWATAVLTDSGGGPSFSIVLPILMSEPICADFTPTSAPTTRRNPRIVRTYRTPIRCYRRAPRSADG